MSTPTPNMGLTGWSLGADAYDHNQLYGNFVLIDGHNHASGNGVRIPTGGLANAAVTTAILADASVTGTKIVNGTIGLSKLAPDAIQWSLGDIKWQWFPGGGSVVLVTGWVIADGSTLGPGQHDWNGGSGSVVLPNLIDKFPYGVDATRVGNAGGNNTLNLAHSHTVNAHSHTVNAHSHTVNAHSHTVLDHSHGIAFDGVHNHPIASGLTIASRQTQTLSQTPTGNDTYLQTLYIPGFNIGAGSANASLDNGGGHSHGGATAGSGNQSSGNASPGTSADGSTTSSDTATTASALSSSTDTRPAWTGLLPLIRIRN